MNLVELYRNERYLEISDQVQNNWLRIRDYLTELNEKFPPGEGSGWVICGSGSPRIMSTGSEE